MPDYGIKVSKSGFDAGTVAIQNTVLHSEANALKIVQVGTVAISVTPPESYATVAHNLGFTPFFLGYFKLVNGTQVYFQNSLDQTNIFDFVSGTIKADGTNVVVGILTQGTASFSGTAYYYYLFGNRSYA